MLRSKSRGVLALLVILVGLLLIGKAFAEGGMTGGLNLEPLGLGLGMAIAVVGGAIGQGLIGLKAMESIGRNPESAGPLLIPMIIALAFVESLVLYMLLIAFTKF